MWVWIVGGYIIWLWSYPKLNKYTGLVAFSKINGCERIKGENVS